MGIKRWRVAQHDESAASKLAGELGLPVPAAALMLTRGIDSPEKAASLSARPDFVDPFLIPGIREAAGRITQALDRFEKIAVYGDYDADGVTATAMLYSYLESCGGDVVYYIPEREGEGYGLNCGAVDALAAQGVKLIVTVDNGISSVEEVAYANSLGIETVVTDHHRPRQVLPEACAVADPYLAGEDECPFRDYAGVGVAFKLITALESADCDTEGLLENYADLLAIGTVGDIVPLKGENRDFVRAGLELLPRTDRPGLRALIEQAGLEGRSLTSENVAYVLVPRINAAGRIGSPDRAVRLLVSESSEEAGDLSAQICADNDCRRQIENEIYVQVLEKLATHPALALDRVIVVDGEDWHHGVIGIVAARVTERFGKPCIIVSCTGEEARGSGRSVEGFSLFDAVCSCAELLLKFGGHPMAAGLSLPVENVALFREKINAYAASLGCPMPVPVLRVDCLLNPEDFTVELPESIRYLEPFGTGNPEPMFGFAGGVISEIAPVGGGKHLRVSVKKKNYTIRCMKFRTTLEEFPYRIGDPVDLAVRLEAREYAGRMTLSVIICDMKRSGSDQNSWIAGRAFYERLRRGEPLTPDEAEKMVPTREEFAGLYRWLRSESGFSGLPEDFLPRLPEPGMSLEKFLTALDVFAEKKLIRLERNPDTYQVRLLPCSEKVSLADAGPMVSLNHYIKAGE